MKNIDVRQFSSDKILKHLDRVSDWVLGGNPAPITVELDMTNVCNHRCPECVVGYFRVNDRNSLPKDLAQRIILQLADSGVKGLAFTGGGEPLCHPDTLQMVQLAKSRGMDVGFITNGTLLNADSVQILLKNCTWIRVSLDAGSAEVFKLTHGVNGFGDVVLNIGLLAKAKTTLNSSCTVGVGFLTSDSSVKDMVKATKLVKGMGADYLQFRPMQIHRGGKFGYQWTSVEKELAECQSYSGNGFQVLHSQHKYEMANDPCYGRDYKKCYGHQFASTVAATGKMYICCHTRGYDKYCIGDLKEQSFRAIWDSDKRQEVASKINFKDCIPLCRDNTFNQILWNIKQPREHVNFL